MEASQCLQKAGLLPLAVRLKEFRRLIHSHHLLCERQICCDDLLHTGLNCLQLGIRHEIHMRATVFKNLSFPDLAVESAWKGIIDGQHLVRKHLMHHLLQHKAEGSDICPTSVRMAVVNKPDIMRIYHLVVQRLELVVHQGRQDIAANVFRYFLQSRSHRDSDLCGGIFNVY